MADAATDVILEAPSDGLREQIERAGGEWHDPFPGSVGRTTFDSPNSEDNSITVLLPHGSLQTLPSQALVRIVSQPDTREYLGVVVKGPFAEPDGLRPDSHLVIMTTIHGGMFMPSHHGRVHVELLGERVDGVLQPPRYRPLPNSPVYVLDESETAAVLRVNGEIRLGVAVGHDKVVVGVPSDSKSVLPRHTAIIGTTGGGKSTTVAGFIAQAQKSQFAVVLLDVEGEYTHMNEPTNDETMKTLLHRIESRPAGVTDTTLYHLVGRETANPHHPNLKPFTLQFSDLSPYSVIEILDLNDAQQERFQLAYETTKKLLRDLKIGQFVDDSEIDEFEGGYPGMRLDHVIDVCSAFHTALQKGGSASFISSDFRKYGEAVMKEVGQQKERTSHPVSWLALSGRLRRLYRLGAFDSQDAQPLNFSSLLDIGSVSIIDLSDTESPDLNNLVITAILRGIQREQERLYAEAERGEEVMPKTLVIIEEAHEFLAKERIDRMPHLFAQVARIAKRGRKRWLGLVFVTQLPQHLPNQVIGLVNNWVVHKISDASVVSTLKESVSSIDDSLWTRLPGLAPGQAIVSFTHMHRPVLTAIDPTTAKLRMVD
jgi:DNA helicase HerA-like ATPase